METERERDRDAEREEERVGGRDRKEGRKIGILGHKYMIHRDITIKPKQFA